MIADIKRQARAALHESMFVPASYVAPGVGGLTTPSAAHLLAGLILKVRWHNKMKISGERTPDDAAVIEGVNRIVFNTANLAELGLTPVRLAVIVIADYEKSFRLDYHEESDGPLNDYWSVIELGG